MGCSSGSRQPGRPAEPGAAAGAGAACAHATVGGLVSRPAGELTRVRWPLPCRAWWATCWKTFSRSSHGTGSSQHRTRRPGARAGPPCSRCAGPGGGLLSGQLRLGGAGLHCLVLPQLFPLGEFQLSSRPAPLLPPRLPPRADAPGRQAPAVCERVRLRGGHGPPGLLPWPDAVRLERATAGQRGWRATLRGGGPGGGAGARHGAAAAAAWWLLACSVHGAR